MKLSAKILSIVLCVLLIFSAICNIIILSGGQTYSIALKCISIIALIAIASAFYYTFRGYTKASAPAYKAYMIICAVYFQTICCVNAIAPNQYSNTLYVGVFVASNSLLFGLFLLLGIAKDMGQKQTFAICIISLVLTLLALIECIFWDKSSLAVGLGYLLLTRVLTRFLLTAVACFMVYFKYQDKTTRGTK